MAIKPNHYYIDKEVECDWCGKMFVLAKHNQLCDDVGNWLLSICDECRK